MLYQDKNNGIHELPDLIESELMAKELGLTRLTDKQLKAYADKPLVGVWNGNEWIVDNEKIEETRVQNINSYTQSFIYSKYSQPKQSSANLGVYDEDYKQEMVTFIKRIVDLSNEAIANGTSFEDYKAMLNE